MVLLFLLICSACITIHAHRDAAYSSFLANFFLQYIFVHCPKISQLEWHPFTLTSVSESISTLLYHMFVDEGADQVLIMRASIREGPTLCNLHAIFSYSHRFLFGATVNTFQLQWVIKLLRVQDEQKRLPLFQCGKKT